MWEPNYLTAVEYKDLAKIPTTDTADDTRIESSIAAASRAVDRCCSNRPNGLGFRRQFGQTETAEARYYTPRWDTNLVRWVIEVDDFMTTEDLVVAVDTSNSDNHNQLITAYVVRPRDALLNKRPYTQIAISTTSSVQPTWFKDSAKVTNVWGWDAYPATVKDATFLQSHRFFKRMQAPFGVTGSPPKATNAQVLEKVDSDIELMLKNYVRLGWTV
jgi:hypothetical protein